MPVKASKNQPSQFIETEKVVDQLVTMMVNEDKQRVGLLLYFKVFFILVSIVPVLICEVLKVFGVLDGFELLATIIVNQ